MFKCEEQLMILHFKIKCRNVPKGGAISQLIITVLRCLSPHRMAVSKHTHLFMLCRTQINPSSRPLNSWEHY